MQRKKIDSLNDWWHGLKRPPVVLEIHPSKKCGLRCLFCKIGRGRKHSKNELPYFEYERLIKNAKLLGVSQVMILGKAEPLSRKDILKIMRAIKRQGMYGYVCTNGILLDQKKVEELIKCGWDRIEISLHGSSAYIHDKLVNKKGVFDAIIKNIKMINYLKTKYKVDEPLIGITTTLNRFNYKDIPNIAKLAVLLGVNATSLNPLIPNRYNTHLKMNAKEIKDFKVYLDQSREIVCTAGIDTNYHLLNTCHFNGMRRISNAGNAGMSVSCYFPWLNITIDENGYASQCSFCHGKENIKEKPLDMIWHGAWFDEVRAKVKEGELFKECKGCCAPNIIGNELIKKDLKEQPRL